LLGAAALVVCSAGCNVDVDTAGTDEPSTVLREEAPVVRVVDGDTIIVLLDGREERVRYIGIDAPESVAPDQPVECFGPEAASENARLVAGQAVFLEADVEDRDRFDRLLRYVYIRQTEGDLTMVNLQLVEGGYALAGSFPPNERHRNELRAAERRARANGAGLWTQC
jgi:micrococcal nuclease